MAGSWALTRSTSRRVSTEAPKNERWRRVPVKQADPNPTKGTEKGTCREVEGRWSGPDQRGGQGYIHTLTLSSNGLLRYAHTMKPCSPIPARSVPSPQDAPRINRTTVSDERKMASITRDSVQINTKKSASETTVELFLLVDTCKKKKERYDGLQPHVFTRMSLCILL